MKTATKQVQLSQRVSIRARPLPTTTHIGRRIKVQRADNTPDPFAIIVAWDYDLETTENYAHAVQTYLNKMKWSGLWSLGSNGDEYIAVYMGAEQ
jgi:hypothetical protein